MKQFGAISIFCCKKVVATTNNGMILQQKEHFSVLSAKFKLPSIQASCAQIYQMTEEAYLHITTHKDTLKNLY